MATERLSMTRTREILRQKWELGLSYREIALSVGTAVGAVWLAVKRAAEARGPGSGGWRKFTLIRGYRRLT